MSARKPFCAYLASVKIDDAGQFTVPKEFREDLGLSAGAPFTVMRMGNGLLLIPEQECLERLCDEIGGTFFAAGASAESLLKTLPEVRKHLYEELYRTGHRETRPRPSAQVSRAK